MERRHTHASPSCSSREQQTQVACLSQQNTHCPNWKRAPGSGVEVEGPTLELRGPGAMWLHQVAPLGHQLPGPSI
jgi:hypothetical protein